MWQIARSYAVKASLAGALLAIVLTIAALLVNQPRWFWLITTLADYLFPLNRVLIFPPGVSHSSLLIGYALAFCMNAVLYGIAGLLLGIFRVIVFGSSSFSSRP